MPRLVIHAPDGNTTTVVLGTDRIKFGRADWCQFILRNDAEVSREHADVWLDEEGRVLVEDSSKNGTRVDDVRLLKHERGYAYRNIRIGDHRIEILDAVRTPPPPPDNQPVRFMNDPAPRAGDTQFFPSTRRLAELSQQRLGLLIQLSERIGGAFERKQLLEQALDACCEALAFERGLIVLKTQRGDTELPIARNVQRDETGAFRISRTLINRALIDGERAIVNNPATDIPGNLSESLVRFPICSALCVPILNRGEILGVIYGDRITQAATYQPEDVDFLAAIAQQVGVGLANLRLLQGHFEAQKMFAELHQARTLQQKLLPGAPLQLPRGQIEGYNEPSSTVSGDYFDYFKLNDGRIGLIIADVVGHGLAAALMMANLQSAVRVALAARSDLPTLAAQLNRLICQNSDANVFITAIIGVLDAEQAQLEFVNAGHPLPLLIGRSGAMEPPGGPDANSLPLGIVEDDSYVVQRVGFGEQYRAALLYTDGLTEAADPGGRQLGLDPVLQALSDLREVSTDSLIRTARDLLKQHRGPSSGGDDMTLLALHFE